jgi:hypothetical protein
VARARGAQGDKLDRVRPAGVPHALVALGMPPIQRAPVCIDNRITSCRASADRRTASLRPRKRGAVDQSDGHQRAICAEQQMNHFVVAW